MSGTHKSCIILAARGEKRKVVAWEEGLGHSTTPQSLASAAKILTTSKLHGFLLLMHCFSYWLGMRHRENYSVKTLWMEKGTVHRLPYLMMIAVYSHQAS